jgi:hypothetical protein
VRVWVSEAKSDKIRGFAEHVKVAKAEESRLKLTVKLAFCGNLDLLRA